MSRRLENKGFKEGFKLQSDNTWRGESVREESLTDSQWHHRITTTFYERWTSSSHKNSKCPKNISDASEKLLQSSERPRHFPEKVFSESPTSPTQDKISDSTTAKGVTTTTATQKQTQSAESHSQTETQNKQFVESQTDWTVEVNEQHEYCVRRVDPTIQQRNDS